jgi:CBS domain-containing protein
MKVGQRPVRELMSPAVPTVPPSATIAEVLDVMIAADSSFVVVVSGEAPVGMVTERTLLPRITRDDQHQRSLASALFRSLADTLEDASATRRARAATAGEAMSTPLVSVDASDTVAGAVAIFEEHNFRQVPVLDGGRLAGVLRQRDIVRALHAELKSQGA